MKKYENNSWHTFDSDIMRVGSFCHVLSNVLLLQEF